MFQIALMGIIRALVGFGFSFWYAVEGVIDAFNEFIFSIPFFGSIWEIIIDIFW
jgi:hypothetical protein